MTQPGSTATATGDAPAGGPAGTDGTDPQSVTPPVKADAPPADLASKVVPPVKAVEADPEGETPEVKLARLERENANLRQENSKTRVTAKEKAAIEAREELAKEFGKILGLTKDEETEDPATLAAKIEASQQETAAVKRELAVYRGVAKHQADADKLLDSRRFMDAIQTIDPADDEAIGNAIKDAVSKDATLKTSARAAGASGTEFSGGSGEKRQIKDVPLAEAVADRYANT